MDKETVDKVTREVEKAIIKTLNKGDWLTIKYENKIDISEPLKKAYENVNFERMYTNITLKLEEVLAEKLVNKIVTEMGTDIKKLMSNENVREDLRFMLRKNIELVLEKLK